MKPILLLAPLAVASTQAFAMKSCQDLKAGIETKIHAKGVKSYALEVVAASEVGARKVVGSCEGGTRKITYERK